MQRSYFHFIKLYLKNFPIYSDKKWHVNRPENPFHDTFFKIIPCKRFYALLALKVGCQNIEGDLNIFGIFKLNLDAICDGNLSWVY